MTGVGADLGARMRALGAPLRTRLTGKGRRRTPTVLQMENVECGAACLAMVLGYHGRFVPLEELRTACGVSRDGSKALNVVKAARGYGLQCKGYKKEPDALRAIPLPAIVFWNFNHFVVLEGFGRGRAYLNDPASGPRTVSATEFDESYTGVVLIFEAGPEFVPGGERPSVLRALSRRLPGLGAALAYIVLASLALTLAGLLLPALSRLFVDDILVRGRRAWLGPLLAAMAAVAIVRAGLAALQQSGLLRLELKLGLSSSSRFFWHVLRLPVEFFSQRLGGEIASRVQINDKVAVLLSGELGTSLVNLLVAGLFVALMLRYDVTLTGVAVAAALANIGLLALLARTRKDGNRRLLQQRGKLIGTSMSGLQGLETLKATGSESEFFATWAGHQAKLVMAEQQLQVTSRALSLVPGLLASVSAAAVLTLGGLRVIDGFMTAGMLVAFQGLLLGFVEPVTRLVDVGGRLQEADADFARLEDVMRHGRDRAWRDPAPEAPPTAAPKLEGHVELRNVTFGYSRLEPPLITGFSLTVSPGQRVALVGGSGSGKSTISKLVAGLFEPWEGDISLDGVPRDRWPRAIVTNSLALVDQDIVLFEGTIRQNLTSWDETVDESRLVRAAKDACIHDDISSRAGGYDARVQEFGRNFSGGQRQRLDIARALVGDPRIVVMDEATSALDPVTEQRIDDALRRRGCTCIIVAHRLSTIRDCDAIVVLDRGRVVEEGRHEDLMARQGTYYRLMQAN